MLPCFDESAIMCAKRLMQNKDIGSQQRSRHLHFDTAQPNAMSGDVNQNAIIFSIGMMTCQEIKQLLVKTMVVEQILSAFWAKIIRFGDIGLILVNKTAYLVEDTIGLVV